MKNKIAKIGIVLSTVAVFFLSSCEAYLGTIPKGEKIPQTFEDYNAFIRYKENHFFDNQQQMNVLNEAFKTPSVLSSNELIRINYMWDEKADRKIQENSMQTSTNTSTYAYCYQGIAHWNLIIEDADKLTECTQSQREELMSQAKVLRAMAYFHLVNYYADQYTAENARTTRAVPLITSADVGEASPQVTLEELYQFMLSDLTESSISLLPEKGETLFHPTKGAGYAMLARIYMQMSDYENASKYAQRALDINSTLYDWLPYYLENKERYDDPADYYQDYPSVALTNPENYVFAYSSPNAWSGVYSIPLDRAKSFEQGDLRFITKFKFRKYATGDRYVSVLSDDINGGGPSTPEMYYIKAECLARKGELIEAMDVLNKVRETRILPEFYNPLSAATEAQAIEYIRRDKENEYLQTAITFWEMRRFNKEPQYARTLTKEVDGVTYTLKPDSHLWIMPFSEQIMTNPGNSLIEQNTPR